MKKNLLLVPIALISLTPTISMVGCNNPEPGGLVLNHYDVRDLDTSDEYLLPVLITQSRLNVQSNHTYEFVIDMTKGETPAGFDIDHFTFVINDGDTGEGYAWFEENYEFTTNTGVKLQGELPKMFGGNINLSQVDTILAAKQIAGKVTIGSLDANENLYFLFYAYPKDI